MCMITVHVNNLVDSATPVIPSTLKPFLSQTLCSVLSNEEVMRIETILSLFESYVIDNPPPQNAFCDIVYSADGKCSFQLADRIAGFSIKLIILNMDYIRSQRLGLISLNCLYPILVEELLHSLYNIQDEYEVKVRTVGVLQPHYTEATLDNLYQTIHDPFQGPQLALYCLSKE